MKAVAWCAPGREPDACIDRIKAAAFMTTDRAHTLREAINCCRKGGIVSVPGVYGGFPEKIAVGAFMQKGLTMRTGQTHVHEFLRQLTEMIDSGKIDPSFVITHRLPLSEAPRGDKMFNEKKDGCVKAVLDPAA